MIFSRKNLGAVFAVAATVFPALTWASTAANTTITNSVTVTYTDAADNAQDPVNASVAISVNLVASAPLLSSPADVASATENDDVTLTYTITGTANGPDTYDFSSTDARTNLDGDATFTTPGIALGGTTIADAVNLGDTVVTVPFDGTDDDVVNGLAVGDIIVIDPTGTAEEREIASVDESTGAADNTVTITLTAATTSAHGYGMIIGERADIDVVVTTNEVTTGASGTHTVTTTVTSQADAGVTATQGDDTVITVRRPALTVSKYVRNITSAAFNPGVADITVDSTGYYASGVSGNPGDRMRYLIVIDNSDVDAGAASNIVVADELPPFTTLDTGSVKLDPVGDDNVADLDLAENNDAGELDGDTLYVYAGAGGVDTGAGTGGSLDAGEVSYVTFEVTID